MALLARVLRLTQAERRLLTRAFATLVAARLGMLIFSLPVLCRYLERATGAKPGAYTLREAAWAIDAVSRRTPGTRCLARSLALQALLRNARIESELRIGVVKDASGGLIAHAWVLCDGQPVAVREDLSRFTPLPLPRI